MSFALPAQINGLTDREAIADALYRGVLAFDHADEALLRSALTDDATMAMGEQSWTGIPEVKAAVFDRVSKLDTTHVLSNIRVSLESATIATVTCSAMAVHVGTGKGMDPESKKLTSGGMYLCEAVKVGNLWKMKSWKMNLVWLDGDMSVMYPAV